MKKYYLFISIAALIGFSSCASLRVDKRQHSNGWYVDFGTEKKSEAASVIEKQEEATPLQVAQVSSVVLTDAPNPYAVTAQEPNVSFPEAPIETTTTAESTAPGAVADSEPSTATNQNENANPANNPSEVSPGSDNQLLLVILAIFIPPLAVYLVQGLTGIFWITLICWLFGGVFFFGRFGYGYLGGLGLLAIVLALLVVFGKL